MRIAAAHDTLVSVLWPSREGGKALRAVLLALAGSLLLTASAKVQVPFWPVPMTMQTMVVVMIGMAYGSRLGAATVLLYLLEGAFGLPVFAGTPEKGIGIAYMLGATGGYLAGFVAAAWACGWLAERGLGRSIPGAFAAFVAGHVILFVPGVAWLGALLGWDKAVMLGLTPFLAASALKIALATALLPLGWRFAGKRG